MSCGKRQGRTNKAILITGFIIQNVPGGCFFHSSKKREYSEGRRYVGGKKLYLAAYDNNSKWECEYEYINDTNRYERYGYINIAIDISISIENDIDIPIDIDIAMVMMYLCWFIFLLQLPLRSLQILYQIVLPS